MSRPITAIANLGPAMAEAFARAGLGTAEELYDLGPDRAYARLLEAGERPHFIGYYALVMGLQGRPWNDCRGEEKTALRVRFDRIKAAATAKKDKGRTRLDAALDEIGLIERGRQASRDRP